MFMFAYKKYPPFGEPKPPTLPAAQVTNGDIVGFDVALQAFLLHFLQKLKDNFPLPHGKTAAERAQI